MDTRTNLEPQNVIAHLRELHALTGDEKGAQREAWTETWETARRWLRDKLAPLPVAVETDEAGNTWATLPGASPKELVIGSHIDSVPNGGWLDGCLGVVAGLEVLRHLAANGQPPVTVRLVSWADEEGSRFTHSLVGSGITTGMVAPENLQAFTDKDGNRMGEVLARHHVHLATAGRAARQLDKAVAYLELHIEQGPVLESKNLPLAVVLGTLGVERHAIHYTGQTGQAGSVPMAMRRDALAPAARLELEIKEIARRHGGFCTMGSVVTSPGIPTSVVGRCDVLLDQRQLDRDTLAQMLAEAKEASRRFAAGDRVEEAWVRIFHVDPAPFHPELVELCAEAVQETSGGAYRMASGPLHDAAYVCLSGVPTAMIFVQSLRGMTHAREEDSREEHILLGVEALDRLAAKTLGWITSK